MICDYDAQLLVPLAVRVQDVHFLYTSCTRALCSRAITPA